QLLRDSRLDYGLGRNLDRFSRCRVPPHTRFPLLNDELDHTRQDELAGSLQFLLRQSRQLVEELASLSALHVESFREVRKQLGFTHATGVGGHRVPLTCSRY